MKLSKALLGAMLVGITVQTTLSSCNKNDKDVAVKPQTEKNNPDSPNIDPCPACGMG